MTLNGEHEGRPAPGPVDCCEGGTLSAACRGCTVRPRAVCATLSDAELARLDAIAARVSAASGTDIFREGEPAGALYNLTAGTVKLYKLLPDGRWQITGFLFPGDFLGLAMNDFYAHTAEAVGDVALCRFPRGRFEGLLGRIPRLEHCLLAMASNELVQARDQMLLLGRKTASEKIASFLLLLSRRKAARGELASPIRLLPGNAIELRDRAALEALAEGG
ncbi:MAG: cyclic nucleotide-binding domain-containing protein [Alphaproteobacteria bacterium]|nr:cyclic nucleotide-binding domain-containing protein [Alphaproteobacteria bacterium]